MTSLDDLHARATQLSADAAQLAADVLAYQAHQIVPLPKPPPEPPPAPLVETLLDGPTRLPPNQLGLSRGEIAEAWYGSPSQPTGFWTTPTPLDQTESVGTSRLRQHFYTAGRPSGSGSTWGQIAAPFEDSADATCEIVCEFPNNFDWSPTGKVGGIVAYNGGDWPGGAKNSPANCSARFIWNKWGSEPLWGMYVYSQPDGRDLGQNYKYDWPTGTRWEFLLGPITQGAPVKVDVRVELGAPGAGQDKITAYVDGDERWSRDDLYLLEEPGMLNRAYLSMMCGWDGNTGPPSGYTSMFLDRMKITRPMEA